MIRPPTKLLLAGLIAAAILAGFAGSASAEVRNYNVTYVGHIYDSYRASDSTAFDIQRAGYAGCDYKQTGNILVEWTSVWRLTANVQPRSGRVRVLGVKKVSGPFDKKRSGLSGIGGTNSNEGMSTQCSDSHHAGKIDCTSHDIRPAERFPLKARQSQKEPKDLELQVPGFSSVHATYTGTAPSGFSCARSVGSNSVPGGFVDSDLFSLFGDLKVSFPIEDLAGLGKRETMRVGDPGLGSEDWLDPFFPRQGQSCALTGENDETCTYGITGRGGAVKIGRVS